MANEKRLIDANALRDDTFILDSWDAKIVRAWLNDQPTVDAVEVVHGRWEEYCGGLFKCTACGHEYLDYLECKDYCGNCGAKMDGGNSNV